MFLRFFSIYKNSKNQALEIDEFYSYFVRNNHSFDNKQQHDSHEFLLKLLENLEADFSEVLK